MDNGIKIELFVKNGYNHFDDENEQWVFLDKMTMLTLLLVCGANLWI